MSYFNSIWLLEVIDGAMSSPLSPCMVNDLQGGHLKPTKDFSTPFSP